MKEKDDILKKAVENIKQTLVPDGPPKQLVDSTINELKNAENELHEEQFHKQVVSDKRFILNNIFKIAAAIIISISIGYAAGRISAPKSLDIEQVQAELEPAIREKLFDEVTQYVQLGLTNNYVELKEELTEQYIEDLRMVSMDILNASGSMTNQLLEELIQSIATAQLQNRQWVEAALKRTELNRIQDKSQLGNALLNFASRTEQDLAVIATYLKVDDIDNTNLNELENPINYNQGDSYENLIQNN